MQAFAYANMQVFANNKHGVTTEMWWLAFFMMVADVLVQNKGQAINKYHADFSVNIVYH